MTFLLFITTQWKWGFILRKICRSRTAQLIYQSMFCGVGIIGILASLGLFHGSFRWDFYLYFTNLSNYLCIGIMFAELVQTAKRKSDDYVSTAPRIKFVAMMGIMLTFFVFNFLLAGNSSEVFSVNSIILHVILPLAFTIDWLLFYEHGKVKISNTFISMIFPLSYVGYVYFHAFILGFNTSIINWIGSRPLIYPYFFLDVQQIGVMGVIQCILILTVCFAVFSLIFTVLDRLLKKIA